MAAEIRAAKNRKSDECAPVSCFFLCTQPYMLTLKQTRHAVFSVLALCHPMVYSFSSRQKVEIVGTQIDRLLVLSYGVHRTLNHRPI